MSTVDNQAQRGAKQSTIDWSDALVCTGCGMTVTHPDFRMEKSGRLEHLQVNPLGKTFVFSTFSRAVGVFVAAQKHQQHSWFNGYDWQIAHCQGCATHLGWQFVGDDAFFALLNDKLTVKKDAN